MHEAGIRDAWCTYDSRHQANDYSIARKPDRETAQSTRHDSGDELRRYQSAWSLRKLVVDQLSDRHEGQDVRGERVAQESKPSVVERQEAEVDGPTDSGQSNQGS
jgi:hypothetical protein